MIMILGVDFDNTLACYDGLFHAEAVERGLLSSDAPKNKRGVRDVLRSKGQDVDFTRLQGYVYGPGIMKAPVYDGAVAALRDLIARGTTIYIISHKTRFPYIGPKYDLHDYAYCWLKMRGLYEPGMFSSDHVFLELSKSAKLERIAALGCTHFIDDLPEFLNDPDFPQGVERLLFLPCVCKGKEIIHTDFPVFSCWLELLTHLRQILIGPHIASHKNVDLVTAS